MSSLMCVGELRQTREPPATSSELGACKQTDKHRQGRPDGNRTGVILASEGWPAAPLTSLTSVTWWRGENS
jgi:hypothetical protein